MILVDDRVGSAEIRPLLNQPSVLCRLDYADFAFSGNGPDGPCQIGIERKSLMDFLQSMTSGRLSGHQLIGLKQEFDWVYLLVEGVWRPDRKSGVIVKPSGKKWLPAAQGSRRFMAREVWSFINTLQVLCNIYVVTTSNQWESAFWIDSLFGWWAKKWEGHKSHAQWNKAQTYATLQKPSLSARVASQFDGIGWDKAKNIGSEFSATELMNAGEDQLTQVEGIGPKLAQSIIEQRKEDEWNH